MRRGRARHGTHRDPAGGRRLTQDSGDAADFDIVPVVIGEYENHPRLDGARGEAELVVDLFAEYAGGSALWWTRDEPRTQTSVMGQLEDWIGRSGDRNSLVFWIGHGTSNDDGAWLATYETPNVITASGVNPPTMVERINRQWSRRRDRPGAWTLLVIEACGAGAFVEKMAGVLWGSPNRPERLGLVGFGGRNSAGNLGQFGQIVRATLTSYNDNARPCASCSSAPGSWNPSLITNSHRTTSSTRWCTSPA